MKTFLCSYVFNGTKWGFEIQADSMDQAMEKLRWMKMSAVLDGEALFSIPIESWYGNLWRWLRKGTR